MPLQPRITALAQAVGADVKALVGGANKPTALTSAAMASLAGSAGLVVDRIYRLTDTKQIAIATSTSTYDLWIRAGEQGFVVSATAPAAPYVGQVWLKVP